MTLADGTETRRQSPVYLMAIAGALLIIAGLALRTTQSRETAAANDSAPVVAGLPRELAGQEITASETGTAALAEIESMHGKGFDLTGGEVAHYGAATLWVAQAADTNSARAMVDSMTARIAEGGSPFQPAGSSRINGHAVYSLTGMGQAHYYWQAGNSVAWLAIGQANAEQGLRQALASLDQR